MSSSSLLRALLGRGLAALAPGRLVLRGRAALFGASALARLLATVLRGVGRVGDPGGARLRHALLLERLVLLLVLDVGSLRGHGRAVPGSSARANRAIAR